MTEGQAMSLPIETDDTFTLPDGREVRRYLRYSQEGNPIDQYVDQDGQIVELYEMLDLVSAEAAPIADVLAAAGVPNHVTTEQLVNRPLAWMAWQPQTALLPETGEHTDGFFCVVKDTRNAEVMTVFVGGMALCRVLRKLQSPHTGGKPFRASIEKRGRTWTFR